MKLNQFVCIVICLLPATPFLFAQKESLTLSERIIRSGHWCSVSDLISLHNGDTLVLKKKEERRCTQSMRFRSGNKILLKEFTGRTYDGKPVLEFKTKGKWHLEKGTTQILILDFKTIRIELQLINSKNDSIEFVVKNRKQ